MTVRSLLPLYQDHPDREDRDRLEILTALLNGPSFDPVFREAVIRIPRDHPVYPWGCVVVGCERVRSGGTDLCSAHRPQWCEAQGRGVGRAEFLAAMRPLAPLEWEREVGAACRICPQRPASPRTELGVCRRHEEAWRRYRRAGTGNGPVDFEQWVLGQEPCEGYGDCRVVVCPSLAESPLGLCSWHKYRYRLRGHPGGAALPASWRQVYESQGRPVPVAYDDEAAFRAWCARTAPAPIPGQINLRGLRPLLRAEIQWGLFANAQQQRHNCWHLDWVQRLANLVRDRDAGSLTDLDLADFPSFPGAIAKRMLHHLRLVYFTPSQTREAGFLETDHFGIRFPHRASHIDLTAVSQRWLRDLLWDYLADLLRSPRCPRGAAPVDGVRRAATELSAFLEVDAAGGGHDPAVLRVGHMQRFVADQRHRERHGLPSLSMRNGGGAASTVTAVTRMDVFNGVRKLLRDALEDGTADRLGLDRAFITAMPFGGGEPLVARRPFPDEVARALADEANLRRLTEADPDDQGIRDIWETIVVTGRRVNEVLRLRWDCIGRYGGLAMFWHDQPKVGNLDAAIRIPERLYETLARRQRTTLDRFAARHGYRPAGARRAALALFPSRVRNPDGTTALSYQWFHTRFRGWVDQLDLGRVVPHQARHSLATSLLRHGATLTHIRRYLGQVSDRMAERYVHLSHSDLEDVLQHVWVAGPGAANPGELLSAGTTSFMTREQATALAVDLSRRSTPAEGGFCTFQPVVDGKACPWNLDCHHCDKFVLSCRFSFVLAPDAPLTRRALLASHRSVIRFFSPGWHFPRGSVADRFPSPPSQGGGVSSSGSRRLQAHGAGTLS